MAEKEHPLISDPKRLRALSHPLRWKLISLIDSEQTATATRCAEVLGESVASCSYHLNMLAKYDFVEEAPGGQGREKPWRLVSREQSFSGEGLGEEGQLAAEAASEAFMEYEFGAMRDRLRRRSIEPAEWRSRATGFNASTVYLTPAEAVELRERLREIIDRHDERWNNPDLRPSDARQVRVFLSTLLVPEIPKT
ncbi:MAG TPA: helix-turn-helix domain-containing protein [Pseudonocardiaceae bacterium]|jgi:predicted ArsR family transcriptional regulator|nr:helix-turn-helix domain-containing protein [Pseudonocardiaceae bacterium]